MDSPTMNITRFKFTVRIPCFLLILLTFLAGPVAANLTDVPSVIKSPFQSPEIDTKGWILVDFETGWILGGKNIALHIEPASLTKLMTSYLVFAALEEGRIRLEDEVYVSEKAWEVEGSRMYIKVNSRVTVLNLLQGMIIQSGNDAAIALAEHIGGTEENFAKEMNLMAVNLNMVNSSFRNSSGLPAENHYSTAFDMTLLSIALIRRFPEYYKFYSQLEFTYNNITQRNRNVLLTKDSTVDGIKTGYTRNAGYCMIGTAVRDGFRLVATVIGSTSRTQRANQVQALLRYGYVSYESLMVFPSQATVQNLPLWKGYESEAPVGVSSNLWVLYPKGKKALLSAAISLPDSLEVPILKGKEVGHVQVKYDGKPFYQASLHTIQNHPEGPWYYWFTDIFRRLQILFSS